MQRAGVSAVYGGRSVSRAVCLRAGMPGHFRKAGHSLLPEGLWEGSLQPEHGRRLVLSCGLSRPVPGDGVPGPADQ